MLLQYSMFTPFEKANASQPDLFLCFQLQTAVRDGAVTLKGSHSIGDGRILSKNLRASLFNDDLSNEPCFDRIHLPGQIF